MAVLSARVVGHSGVWLLCCVLGCASEQNDDLGPGPVAGGGGSSAGSESQTGGGGSSSAAGTTSTGGGGSASAGTAGSFSNGGTFNSGGSSAGGSINSGGSFGSSGTSTGGSAGATGGGGASSGGGGASAGGSGTGGGGTGSGGKSGAACKSDKLTPSGATASGSERADLGPEFAIDGDTTTSRWGSDTKNDAAWLMLDLGEVVTVNRVVLVWEAAYATSFKLQVATGAAGPFTDFYSNANGTGGTADVTAFTPATGRYVRMQGVTRKTEYGYSLFDLSVYGDKDETCD